jgi:hypothetical protein
VGREGGWGNIVISVMIVIFQSFATSIKERSAHAVSSSKKN